MEEVVIPKRGKGRPPGAKNLLPSKPRVKKLRPFAAALEASGKAAENVMAMEEAMASLSDPTRLLFESLMMGNDELVSALASGNSAFFTGISKMVTLKDGTRMLTSAVTSSNVHELDQESYNKLNRYCASQIRRMTAVYDYRRFTAPIREYIQKLAPMALGRIANIAQFGKKEENQLKAAQDLLDRAGEIAPAPEKDIVIPVQVNIVLTEGDGRTHTLSSNS